MDKHVDISTMMMSNKELTAMLMLESAMSLRNVMRFEKTDKKRNLSVLKFNILSVIYEYESSSMRDIADVLDIRRSNFSKYIEELLNEGYVTRVPDSNDRRKITVTLTAKGKKTFLRYKKVYMKALSETFGCFTELEMIRLNDALITIQTLMRKYRNCKLNEGKKDE